MTITYATGVGGYSARRFACTHNDPLCSYSAVVVVLEDGRWYGDALCADHAPTSALRSLAAAEAGKGACTPPPAATEGQGAVSASPAPAPGGPICKTTVPAGTPMVAVSAAEWTELVQTYDAWGRDRLVGSLEVAEAAEALILASRGVS